jgi:hypothetical protein
MSSPVIERSVFNRWNLLFLSQKVSLPGSFSRSPSSSKPFEISFAARAHLQRKKLVALWLPSNVVHV